MWVSYLVETSRRSHDWNRDFQLQTNQLFELSCLFSFKSILLCTSGKCQSIKWTACMLNFIYVVQCKWHLRLKISVQGPFKKKRGEKLNHSTIFFLLIYVVFLSRAWKNVKDWNSPTLTIFWVLCDEEQDGDGQLAGAFTKAWNWKYIQLPWVFSLGNAYFTVSTPKEMGNRPCIQQLSSKSSEPTLPPFCCPGWRGAAYRPAGSAAATLWSPEEGWQIPLPGYPRSLECPVLNPPHTAGTLQFCKQRTQIWLHNFFAIL